MPRTRPPTTVEVVATVGGVRVRCRVGERAVYSVSGMRIDGEGAPKAYHPRGSPPGLDLLANAGRPGDWFGVVTDRHGSPVVQKARDPATSFYAQRLLAKNKCGGFDPDRIDGEYGELTAAAVWRAKWMLGYPERLMNRNFGPKLNDYLSGTKPLPAAYAKARATRLKESKSQDGIRKQIVRWANWGVENTGQIGYDKKGPRLEALGSPGHLPLVTDCSAFATLCYNWAGAPNPNEAGPYDGKHLTYTGTMLKHCQHIPRSSAKPGDLVVWSGGDYPDGSHVGVLVEPGRDPLLVSHGQQSGPARIRFSVEDAYQRGEGYTTLTWLSAFK